MIDRFEEQLHEGVGWLGDQRGPMEELLVELVAENSHTANVEGGNRVGQRLLRAMTMPGLSCETIAGVNFANHLVFSTEAPGRPVVLVGHLDTVFAPGTFEHYRRDGDLARGPGVLDMKGGLVVIAFALMAMARIGKLGSLPLRVAVVSDEEVGSPESQPLLVRVAKDASAGLVFEAGRSGDALVTRRKGTGSYAAVAHGKAAHAGNLHHDGINAIWALARFVDRAQRLTDTARGTTVNVGTISGGRSKNTVPDEARAGVDFRFVTANDGVDILAALGAAAEQAAIEVPGSRVELRGGISRAPLERSAASIALLDEYAACARACGLGGAEAPLAGGGSDANTLSSAGVPCIDGLGPRGAGYHTPDEHVELATLVPKASALFRFLMGRLAG